jgi:acetyl esterase/lipase
MHFYKYSPVVLFFIVLVSCKKDVSTGNMVVAVNEKNIAYGADPSQKIDVYLPANRTAATTKVIVTIHGGSWTSGDKKDLTGYVDSLKRRLPDYAIFNINYRLSATPNNVFPAQENDVKAALDFIYSKSAEYLISDKYALVGVSAGAHLAMLQGFKYTSPVKPKVVASFSGPSDLIEMYYHPVGGNSLISLALAQAVGFMPQQDSLLYATSSPVNFITNSSPPTIIFQGGTDPLVSATQATEVQTKLANAGVTNQYVFYPDAAHIGFWDNATMFDAFNKLQAFIEANVL